MAGWKKELSAGRPGRQDCSDYLMTNLIPRMRHTKGMRYGAECLQSAVAACSTWSENESTVLIQSQSLVPPLHFLVLLVFPLPALGARMDLSFNFESEPYLTIFEW